MKYTNPVISGFYPDPSVCYADGRYYLVCSSFQYFPGVPLFESTDLVNWTQIGHVLTRKSQVMLEGINSSGGVFAPTIRYNAGRFYMVTTNDTTHQNFYVYTDDICGEWSEPIFVDQGGIDPSLYFEDGKTYFMSNGSDDDGVGGVVQCEIDIETGRKLSRSKAIWHGTGGRYLESPHLYKIGEWYYLMAAEGGTEYGHMITCARSRSPWGEFESCPHNPVLTNRNKAPYIIQGIGHGDLVEKDGEWFILSLGFRQIHMWQTFHHLGREVFLTPVRFEADGWFRAGDDGTTDESYEIAGEFEQRIKSEYTFENTDWNIDWCFIRHPEMENYQLGEHSARLTGTKTSLDEVASPTFVGIRQREFCGELSCRVSAERGEAGLTVYMDEAQHYEIAAEDNGDGTLTAAVKLTVGDVKCRLASADICGSDVKLLIRFDNMQYHFFVLDVEEKRFLASARTKYLSTEVAGGFTGVLFGLYAVNGIGEFREFSCNYSDQPQA